MSEETKLVFTEPKTEPKYVMTCHLFGKPSKVILGYEEGTYPNYFRRFSHGCC